MRKPFKLPPLHEYFELPQLLDPMKFPISKKPPHNWKKWPKPFREAAQAAVTKHLKKLPSGSRIVSDRSFCDIRADLSGRPYQLYRMIKVKLPA